MFEKEPEGIPIGDYKSYYIIYWVQDSGSALAQGPKCNL